MDRDARLTGSLRGQRDDAKAPPGFEVGSLWKVCSSYQKGLKYDSG